METVGGTRATGPPIKPEIPDMRSGRSGRLVKRSVCFSTSLLFSHPFVYYCSMCNCIKISDGITEVCCVNLCADGHVMYMSSTGAAWKSIIHRGSKAPFLQDFVLASQKNSGTEAAPKTTVGQPLFLWWESCMQQQTRSTLGQTLIFNPIWR